MNRIFSTIIVSLFCIATFAQSDAVKNVSKSVFTLTTFNKDGSIHASSRGVFVGANGEAVSIWTPFIGADRAVVIDAEGNKHDVSVMLGANELYDVCRFRIDGATNPASVAKSSARGGDKTWLLQYSVKKAKTRALTINSVERFMNKYGYYIYTPIKIENQEGCPVVNASGEVIGLLQKSKSGSEVYSTDINFAVSGLDTINGFSINNKVLAQTGIRVALPADYNQAAFMLMLAGQKSDSAHYAAYADDFIKSFPTYADGYTAKARLVSAAGNYQQADELFAEAIKKVDRKDIVFSDYANIVYQKNLYLNDSLHAYEPWTLDLALTNANLAYHYNSSPTYLHQQGQILFAMKRYQQAYDVFMQLSNSDIRNGEIFYEAAQCKTQLGATDAEVLALLDSAVAACPQPLTSVSASYLYVRGTKLFQMGEYRKALADYNQYDTLMLGRGPANFYFARYQCELKLHQYKQALNDIAHAAVLAPRQTYYLAEMASLQLRLKQYDDAIKTADICIKRDSAYTDAYLVKGLAHIYKGEKQQGLAALEQAKALGDARADELIEKNK